MSDSKPQDDVRPALELLPYHTAIRDFLKRTDPEVWNWFASSKSRQAQIDAIKFDLLKSTYRIERATQPELYETVEQVASEFAIVAPATIYQSQHPAGLNASLAYIPAEIHLVLHGPIVTQLTATELRCLIGHELSHYLLWHDWGGELLVAAEMLAALANDTHAQPAHFASYRLLGLYNEIFCDHDGSSTAATGDMLAVVSMLVKVATGIQEVSPEGYLRQAEEIFAQGDAKADEQSHPEAFIRARAVKLWAERHADASLIIERMIEGTPKLDELDLLAQERVAARTRRLFDVLLSRKWFQTDPILAHARLFFDDYSAPTAAVSDSSLAQEFKEQPDSLSDYFCFILLDFATADRDLDEPPLAAALELAGTTGNPEALRGIASERTPAAEEPNREAGRKQDTHSSRRR